MGCKTSVSGGSKLGFSLIYAPSHMGSCVGYFMTFDCPVAPKPRGVQTSLSLLHTSDHLEGWRQIILAQGIPFIDQHRLFFLPLEINRSQQDFRHLSLLSSQLSVCTCVHMSFGRRQKGWMRSVTPTEWFFISKTGSGNRVQFSIWTEALFPSNSSAMHPYPTPCHCAAPGFSLGCNLDVGCWKQKL